jgi:hypothetical protein
MNKVICIDPGIHGGIAWIEDDTVKAAKMPDGMTEQADFIRSIVVANPGIKAILERTGTYKPGNSGVGAVTFARHCGNLEMCLYMLSVPTDQVAPSVWQKGIGTWSKDKKERKNQIKEWGARKYPHLKVTLDISDAVAMLAWATKEVNIPPAKEVKKIAAKATLLRKIK